MGCLQLTYYSKYGALEEAPIFHLPHLGKQAPASKNRVNCSPFGVTLDGRNLTLAGAGEYRYSFQNQEHDDEIKGAGNSINFEYRMHDPRLGRFFAIDPLAKQYPHNSPYAFSENCVINSIELEGLEKLEVFAGGSLNTKIGGKLVSSSIAIVVNYDVNTQQFQLLVMTQSGSNKPNTIAFQYNSKGELSFGFTNEQTLPTRFVIAGYNNADITLPVPTVLEEMTTEVLQVFDVVSLFTNSIVSSDFFQDNLYKLRKGFNLPEGYIEGTIGSLINLTVKTLTQSIEDLLINDKMEIGVVSFDSPNDIKDVPGETEVVEYDGGPVYRLESTESQSVKKESYILTVDKIQVTYTDQTKVEH